MPQVLPLVPSVGDYTFTTTINGNTYNFRVRWNARASLWFIDVADPSNVPIASGIAVVLGEPLGISFAYTDPFMTGRFFARDTTGANREATFDDLGLRVIVEYWSLNDLITAALGS